MERVFGLEQWKAKLITFVSDTCGAVNTRAFNKNLKELKVLGHMHDTIKGLVHELRQSTLLTKLADDSYPVTDSDVLRNCFRVC